MITPTLELEIQLWKDGYSFVCGIDEVGRGCFAGPVCAGAVIFPKNSKPIKGVADSKLLKPKLREKLAAEIKKSALSWSVSEISLSAINKYGIGKATQMAFRKSIKLLSKTPDFSAEGANLFILIDAFFIKHLSRKNQRAVMDGDKICYSISAASIIAKVYRDKLMEKLSLKYPHYNFAKNKGYGTKDHRDAIKKYGLSKLHRKSFNLDKFL